MKKFLFTFCTLFWAIMLMSQNSLSIPDINTGVGRDAKIAIDLDNAQEVVALQFTMKVPSGLIVKEKETTLTDRKSDQVVSVKRVNSTEFLFIVYSLSNTPLKGSKGALLEIPIVIPASYKVGDSYPIELKDVILSSKNATDIGSEHKNGTLNMVDLDSPDLTVSNITFGENSLTPKQTASFTWNIKNIGELDAEGSLTEKITLVSATTGVRYQLGSTSLTGKIGKNESISRAATFTIPAYPGLDGNVQLEVVVIPSAAMGEYPDRQENNTVLSTQTAVMEKLLYLSLNQKSIQENSTSSIRGTLSHSGDRTKSYTYKLATTPTGQLSHDNTITIANGSSSQYFYLTPIDNNEVDGDRIVTITIDGNSYPIVSDEVTVIDDEIAKMTLASSKQTVTDADEFTVTIDLPYAVKEDLILNITADNANRWSMPKTVTVNKGSRTASFKVTMANNAKPEASVTGTITVRATKFAAATVSVEMVSSNIPRFEMKIEPSTISEGDGIYATYATITRLDKTDIPVVLQFRADMANTVILPKTIKLESGSTSAKFNIGVIDNDVVDTTRIVKISAHVYISDCSCTSPEEVASSMLTILDNDGPTLAVSAKPSTVKAGTNNASVITISRNTVDVSTPLTLALSVDAPSIVIIPATATIPVGKSSVEVPINTKIDANKAGDQTVRIEAQADDFNAGFTWLLVTDQNLPDVTIEKITTEAQITGASQLEVTTAIKNQGFATMPKGATVNYYLSKDKLSTSNATLIGSATLNADIAAGSIYNLVHTLTLPELAGEYFLIVTVNADGNLKELTYNNNQGSTNIKLLPGYTATVSIEKAVYKQGELVSLSGSASLIAGGIAANKEVEIVLSNAGFERTYKVKTNGNGQFKYDFVPLRNESGHYQVSAGYPGTSNTAQGSFDLLGFQWTDKPTYLKWDVVQNVPFESTLKLKNTTSSPLTNVQIKAPVGAGFTITSDPLNLQPGAEGILRYTILATEASTESKYAEYNFEVVSDEGAKLTELAYYYCRIQIAKLVTNPVSINTTMVKDASRYYEFDLINTGSVDAEKVKIAIPNVEWMILRSAPEINKIAAYDTVKVVLELKPTSKQQLNVPLTGTLAVSMSNGNGLSIPFRVETVSHATGKLQIDAVDEYTYYTESAPHVAGAKVVVRHPFSGNVLAEGLTDQNGLFTTDEIPEGYYTVTISAPKHDTYQNNFLVEPGRTRSQTVFMPYQAVTYDWTVKPTEIEDEYQIDMDVKFETNVPKPVVIMTIDNPYVDLEPGQSRMATVTITNHGLIAATKVSLGVDPINGYKFTMLQTDFDVLKAKSSITVPMLIERDAQTTRATGGEWECRTYTWTKYYYECNKETGNWDIARTEMKTSWGCFYIPSTSPGYDYVGPGWNGPGWGWDYRPTNNNNGISTSQKIDCRRCMLLNFSVILDCGSLFAGGWPAIAMSTASWGISEINKPQDDNEEDRRKSRINSTINLGASAATDFGNLPSGAKSAGKVVSNITGGYGCFSSIKEWFDNECFKQFMGPPSSKARMLASIDNPKMPEYLAKIQRYEEVIVAIIDNYFKHGAWYEEENVGVLWKLIQEKSDQNGFISSENIQTIANSFVGTKVTKEDVISYLENWNKSVLSLENPALESGYINFQKLIQYSIEIAEFEKYAEAEGFIATSRGVKPSISVLIESVFEVLEAFSEEHDQEDTPKSSLCATVTVRFSQKMTMTREAFEGTLTLNNGNDENELKEVLLDLVVKDENGNDCTHLFQINKDAFLNGSGIVSPSASQEGTVIFIPTKEAAPTVAKSYSFGGTLSYLDPSNGEKVTISLYPVTLEVNPSPDLVLHYFMQRDILGDDPMTEEIEPMVPAELALIIDNQGYGTAKNVKIESMKPVIIDNKLGLAIDFDIIGSNLNNEPKALGLSNINFGNIEPHKTAVGQWWFTSTLLGHFIEYKINVTHLSSYGNKNLSLVKDAYIHELIKSVKAYQEGHDNINDFLVNDTKDMNDMPDMIYYSNGDKEEVYPARQTSSVSNPIDATQLTTTLTIVPSSTGWNYGKVNDPGGKLYKLTKVVRNSDNLELPLDNFWQTHVTMKDGADPVYENKLHFFDKISATQTYKLYYTPIDTNYPTVVAFSHVKDKEVRTSQVEYIQVEFNKPIDFNSFTTDDIALLHQGDQVNTDKILIGKIDDKNYLLTIEPLTTQSGYYELTIHCSGITDILGNNGVNGARVGWTQVLSELGIESFISDQVQTQPVNSVKIKFNKPVDKNKLINSLFMINENEIPDMTVDEEIAGNEYQYTLNGLSKYNQTTGRHVLSVNMPLLASKDGQTGIAMQQYEWYVDKETPQVKHYNLQYQGAVHNQNATHVEIVLNKPVENFAADWVKLYKNGADVNALLEITKQNDLSYVVSGLADHTLTAGAYKLSVDQSKLKDMYGNWGVGVADSTWVVNFDEPKAVSNLKITPDRGESKGVTSGEDLKVSVNTTEDDRTVIITVMTPNGSQQIASVYVEKASVVEVDFPADIKGLVTIGALATDKYGNVSQVASISAYIDATPFDYRIDIEKNNCQEINKITVEFTDDILSSEFTKDVVVIKASGVTLPNDKMVIVKQSSSVYELYNFDDLFGLGELTMYIDMEKLHKRTSGLSGSATGEVSIGEVKNSSVNIVGDVEAIINSEATYEVSSSGLSDLEWLIVGGEIVSQTANSITVKWNTLGDQSITLGYTTATACQKTSVLGVKVSDGQGIDNESQANKFEISTLPSLNNGEFTLSVSLSGTHDCSIDVYNLNGATVYNNVYPNVSGKFETKIVLSQSNPDGVYLVVVRAKGKKTLSSRVIVNRAISH